MKFFFILQVFFTSVFFFVNILSVINCPNCKLIVIFFVRARKETGNDSNHSIPITNFRHKKTYFLIVYRNHKVNKKKKKHELRFINVSHCENK